MHFKLPEQLLHDPFGNAADVERFDEGKNLLLLVRRHAIGAHAHGQKARELLFQRKIQIARTLHIRAHDAARTDVLLVKVALGIRGEIAPENLIQLACRVAVDIVCTLRLAVCLQIDFTQAFIQLSERELEAGFQRVDVDRRQLVPVTLRAMLNWLPNMNWTNSISTPSLAWKIFWKVLADTFAALRISATVVRL